MFRLGVHWQSWFIPLQSIPPTDCLTTTRVPKGKGAVNNWHRDINWKVMKSAARIQRVLSVIRTNLEEGAQRQIYTCVYSVEGLGWWADFHLRYTSHALLYCNFTLAAHDIHNFTFLIHCVLQVYMNLFNRFVSVCNWMCEYSIYLWAWSKKTIIDGFPSI